MQLLNGRWGPYIAYKKKNYRLPKGTKTEELTFKQCLEIVKGSSKSEKTKKAGAKKTVTKKATTKKTTTKKAGTKKKKGK